MFSWVKEDNRSVRSVPKKRVYFQLRGNETPVRVTVLECSDCGYMLQRDRMSYSLHTYCDRCGNRITIQNLDIGVPVEPVTYREYCEGLIDSVQDYVIYELEDSNYYSIILLTDENQLHRFIEVNGFSNPKIREVGLTELLWFLGRSNNELIMTTEEFYRIRL